MNIHEARNVLEAIERSRLEELRIQFLSAAVRYAGLRVEWQLAGIADRMDLDASRRHAHDAFIDACNILSRQMREAGENNDWRRIVGSDRVGIGDFACLVHCLLALKAG